MIAENMMHNNNIAENIIMSDHKWYVMNVI